MSYTPPFTVSAEAIGMVADISAQIERYSIRLEQSDGLRLRKANRIKTIHSSLAIEGNRLTEGQVQDIMDGKTVVAPLRQIQEVKNAIATYDLFPTLNPFRAKDLLKAHGVMMQALMADAGRFRSGGVGVFEGERCVHIAPPADRVPMLIGDLFQWLKGAKDHLLIRSCVFHFEFEFIHPFSDGNGRMGRLWQSLILSRLNPLFAHLPVENIVYSNQKDYYDAIQAATRAGQSGPFINFMLAEILKTLREHQGVPLENIPNNIPYNFPNNFPNNIPNNVPNNIPNNIPEKIRKNHSGLSSVVWRVLSAIVADPGATADTLGSVLGISSRMVRTHIATLKEQGIIERVGSSKAGYWKLVEAQENK